MNAKFFILLALLISFASSSALAQQEWEILIEPKNPTTRDHIKITVPDSGCYSLAQFKESSVNNIYHLGLRYPSQE